jgi:hypothetical protein
MRKKTRKKDREGKEMRSRRIGKRRLLGIVYN